MGEAFLGIDWGGTYLKAGLVNSRGQIINKVAYSSEKLRKRKLFVKNLEDLLDNFGRSKIKAIGIGAPGIIDMERGFIYYLPNISGWRNYPLASVLKRKLRLPVFIDNDANVFALAEARLGAAKGYSQGIFLTLGTGLGGAVILNNNILHGKTSAAELGHVPMDPEGKKCGCGSRGCIETFIGSNYLLKKYHQLKKNKIKLKEVKEIFERGLRREKEALLIWKEFSKNLGRFLAGMVNIFNPQIIVFGGGVAGAFRLFKPLVFETIRHEAMWPQVKGLKLVKAKLKDAGIIGAAILAKENISH